VATGRAPLLVTLALLFTLSAPVLMPLTDTPALALTCEETLDAAGPDAVTDLQLLLTRASTEGDPAAACDTWTLRLSGTFVLDAQLEYRGAAVLFLTGTSRTAPAVLAGDGHRVLAAFAPAVRIELADLVLRDGSARGADLDGAGGAIAIEQQESVLSEVRATRVALRGNDAARGGAIAADRVTLVDVELDGNTADEGGGVDVFELQATRTTFVGNQALGAPGTGGAIRASGDVTLENSTLSANQAIVGASVWMSGVASPTLRATFSTFASALAAGGGAHVHADLSSGGSVTVALRGSLLDGVQGLPPGGGDPSVACVGSTSLSGPDGSIDSLASDTSCGSGVTLLAAPSGLAPLPPAGGAVGTGPLARIHLPSADSPLIDAVDCDATWPSTDQRGLPRPQPADGRCDAGSVELAVVIPRPDAEPPPTGPTPDGPEDIDEPEVVGTGEASRSEPPLPSRVQAGSGPGQRRPWLSFWRWRPES
jgi:predicted outer membrane repeat protein